MQSISNNLLKQFLYIAILFLLAAVLFWQLASFLPALLGAITLYVLMRKPMLFLTEKKKWKKGLTAIGLMLLSFIVVLLPIALMIGMLTSKINYVIVHSTEVTKAISNNISTIEQQLGYKFFSDANINKLSTWLANALPTLLGATFNTLTTVVVMYFILYFMLVSNRQMESGVIKYINLKQENVSLLGKQLRNTIYSNAIGIPLTACIQGGVALLAYWILDVNDPLFWFVTTCVTSAIPVVGAALAYVSVALLFFANGIPWKGIVMLIYGFGIISTIDSFFRFALQKKMGNIHPIVTLFGVILGVNLFGFIGLIFGPLLISLFILLVKIYSTEFGASK